MDKDIDHDVYDSISEENPEQYAQGFLTMVYLPFSPVYVLRLENLVRDTNALAYIPTDYGSPVNDEHAYSVSYVIHKDVFQQKIFVAKLMSQIFEGRITHKEDYEHPVWFNKDLIREEFDETYMDTYKKRVQTLKNNQYKSHISQILTEEEKYHIRFMAATERKCYIPISDKDRMCQMEDRSQFGACVRCAASRYYGRYDRSGKCIKKLTKDQYKPRRKRRPNQKKTTP